MSFIRCENTFGRIVYIKACEICMIEQIYPADTKLQLCGGGETHVKQAPSDIMKMVMDMEKEEGEKE